MDLLSALPFDTDLPAPSGLLLLQLSVGYQVAEVGYVRWGVEVGGVS